MEGRTQNEADNDQKVQDNAENQRCYMESSALLFLGHQLMKLIPEIHTANTMTNYGSTLQEICKKL